MLYQAAVACTDAMTDDEIASGRTFPAISRIREISKEVACNVIEVALDENLCTKLSRKDVPTRDALSCFARSAHAASSARGLHVSPSRWTPG